MSRQSIDHRLIADPQHNQFVADGVPEHRPTDIAPQALLGELSPEVEGQRSAKQREVVEALRPTVGAPYFSGPGFVLYCGDCERLLAAMSAASIRFHLTVTSPPYNIGKEYERPRDIDDYVDWCASWTRRIFDVTRDDGAFWLNVGFLEVPGQGLCVPIPYLLWNRSPFYLLQEVIWHYGAGVASSRRFSPRNEKWLFYVKHAGSYTFNLDAVRDPNVKYPNQKSLFCRSSG